jgi:hypothetical protein
LRLGLSLGGVVAFASLSGCSPAAEPPSATVAPPPTTSATSEGPATENARSDYEAADALLSAGKYAEARAMFDTVKTKFPYSRVAVEAELRIARIDEKLGRPEAVIELATWAKNHPHDPRAQGLGARAQTVGDTTCHRDADCTTTTKHDCCDCCASGPYATSKTWLAWQAEQCAATRCMACAGAMCPADSSVSPSARCNAGTCELVR